MIRAHLQAINLAWWYLYGGDHEQQVRQLPTLPESKTELQQDRPETDGDQLLQPLGGETNVLVKECPKYGWVTKDFYECGECQERCK